MLLSSTTTLKSTMMSTTTMTRKLVFRLCRSLS
jgi:hypothetical protein